MTYEAHELSEAEGAPVELYTFSRGDALQWRYTSADRDLTVSAVLYTSAVIRRGRIEQGPEVRRSNLQLTVPHDFPIAELYKIAPPSDPIKLVVSEYHEGDSDGEVVTKWQGEIADVRFRGVDAELELTPLSGTFGSLGLRRAYQRPCPFVLYGPECRVNQETYRVTGTVVDVSGLVVTVAEADTPPDGYFDGGFIEWEVATGTYERRFIASHAGAELTLDVHPLGLEVDTEVRMYPGCDHTLDACHGKFSNALNYGGMPYIPQKNPFGSDPIY